MSSTTAVPIDDMMVNTERSATRRHIRGSSLLLVGRMVSLALNFGVQVLTVRYLSKSDYGAFAYALAVVSMGSSVSSLGLNRAIARFVPIYQEQRDYPHMFGTIILSIGTILGFGVALVLLVFGLQGLLIRSFVSNPLSAGLLLIMITLAPLQALDNWFQGMLAIFASPRAIFFRRYVLGPGLKLGAVLLVILYHGNVNLLAFGYLIGGILGVSIYTVMLFHVIRNLGLLRYFRLRTIKMPARAVFGFSIPTLSTDLVFILKSSMAVVLLEYFSSTVDVAEFRAVVPVAGLSLVVFQSFRLLFIPLAARLFALNDATGINDLYWKTAVWITIITFPIFAICFSMAEPLTVLLFGTRYAQSGTILALLALGNYLNAALGFNSDTLKVYGKVGYIVAIDILSAVIFLGLNLWLIPRYGALGAAIGTCCSLIVYNILNHAGLLLGTAIDLFQWQYLKVYLSIVLGAGGLFLVQEMVEPPLYIGGILLALVFLLLLRFNRNVLDIMQMFPELGRIPPVRRFLVS
ncbi:MAG: flippase [Chloroflexota bacterium]